MAYGLTESRAQTLFEEINARLQNAVTADQAWQDISQKILPDYPFSIHLFLYRALFPAYLEEPENAPAWMPSIHDVSSSNLTGLMSKKGIGRVEDFHHFSVNEPQAFWQLMLDTMNIQFAKPFTTFMNLDKGLESPQWLDGAELNIVDSCFQADPKQTAIVTNQDGSLKEVTYQELEDLTNQVANGLEHHGFKPGARIAIMCPMNVEAVAIYLGIIRAGCIVVSIADSFTTPEILERLKIAKAEAIFTQHQMIWAGKKIGLYDKIKNESVRPVAIVIGNDAKLTANDIPFNKFLATTTVRKSHLAVPMDTINILFSSGTTTTPKAIPWTHISAIKAASDAFCHQNIKQNDILCWPTNLGWMMGPWLIFAALINRASIALYLEAPKDRAFGEFVSRARVTMLGVVPTLVHTWRQSKCMEGLDWQSIKLFSTTGECSNPEDMLYLMSLANYKPVIEYCGGTEISGSYLSSTILNNNCPSLFSTFVMGIQGKVLNSEGKDATTGEIAIVAPAFGLSNEILNANHHDIYYANMPKAENALYRRHGDYVKKFSNGYYMMLGRIDDTMNLGGIKISSAEIERVISKCKNILEAAAVGVRQAQGPESLVIYAVLKQDQEKDQLKKELQSLINQFLNPLFKIHDVLFVETLPKTASNKIMRRKLREEA